MVPWARGAHLLSLAEVAWRLGAGYSTVRAMVRRGELPAVRLGRRVMVADADVRDLITRNRAEAAERFRMMTPARLGSHPRMPTGPRDPQGRPKGPKPARTVEA